MEQGNWKNLSWWMNKLLASGKKKTTEQEYLPSFIRCQNQFDIVQETENGLYFKNVYIPEEIILYILSYIDPKQLLKYSLVCHKWNNLIKSYKLWSDIYKQRYRKRPKQLPWYVYYCLLSTNYFDTNLLLNGNGQHKFNHWVFTSDGGHECVIEDPPDGSDPLPLDVPDFCNQSSCFTTSYGACCKAQRINFGKSKLFQYILDNYKPHIYLSEWTAGRFDYSWIYKLECHFIVSDKLQSFSHNPNGIYRVEQWHSSKWEKVEITVTEYPEGVGGIIFEHQGHDTQFWAGQYGCKMAGGVVKILFDTIETLPIDTNGNEIPTKFSKIRYVTNGDQIEDGDQLYFYKLRRASSLLRKEDISFT